MEILRKSKHIALWFYEGKLYILTILYIVLALCLLNFFNYIEPSFRLTGLFLQILGIGTVIRGFNQTRKQFNHKPYKELFANWLERFPIKSNPTFIETEEIKTSATILSVTLTNFFNLDPDSPVEEQLTKIEAQIRLLENRLDINKSKNIDEIKSLKSNLTDERNERIKSINESFKIIESTSTGGIHISLIGTIWLLIGVIFSTASLELSKFFGT